MLLAIIWLCLILLFLVIIVTAANSDLKGWVKGIIIVLFIIILFLLGDMSKFIFWLIL